MTPRESYNFAPVYWSRWVAKWWVLILMIVVVVTLVGVVVAVVGLDVDRVHGLGFVVVGGTYL